MNAIPRTEQIIKPDGTMISTAEAARRLGVQPHTLRCWRMSGRGPRFTRYSSVKGARTGRCLYMASDVEAYRAERTFDNVAAETMAAAAKAEK